MIADCLPRSLSRMGLRINGFPAFCNVVVTSRGGPVRLVKSAVLT